MRLGICLGLAGVGALAWSACTSEATPPIYLDTEYQLRCLDCPQHAPDAPERDIALLDGEVGLKVECEVAEIGGKLSLTLKAMHDSEDERERYGFRLTRVNIDDDEQSSECKVRVIEGANTYESPCTGGDPTAELPCKVSLESDGKILEGSMACNKIKAQGVVDGYRYLVAPGTTNRAAKVAVHNCSGL